MNTTALILTLALGLVAGPLAARGVIAADPLVITGRTLIDGTGRTPLSDSVIVVRDGKIVTVTTGGAEGIPRDARRLDAHGKWIIPGLIDAHVHYYDYFFPVSSPRTSVAPAASAPIFWLHM